MAGHLNMAVGKIPARSRELSEWFGNPRGDFFAGIVSAFAVIPEVVGFTIVAGVDPVLGLYTSVAFLLLALVFWLAFGKDRTFQIR